jgi:hypothetical protein
VHYHTAVHGVNQAGSNLVRKRVDAAFELIEWEASTLPSSSAWAMTLRSDLVNHPCVSVLISSLMFFVRGVNEVWF